MKIFSWNVNGIRAVDKKGELENFINSKNPDVVCFQEIKIDSSQIEKEKFDEKYPEYQKFWSHAGRKGYSGTAIWTKKTPDRILTNFSNDILKKYDLSDKFGNSTTEGRICVADFGDFWLATVYTPNTKNNLERLKLRQQWDKAFLDFIKKLENNDICEKYFEANYYLNISENLNTDKAPKPVFFCGDLNVAHQEIDLANPKANRGKHGFTDEEREGFSNFINNGFKDIFRNQHPDEPNLYTWWSHFAKSRERNIGWRIDYFLTNLNESSKIVAKIHPEIMGSDHCPVSVEFDDSKSFKVDKRG